MGKPFGKTEVYVRQHGNQDASFTTEGPNNVESVATLAEKEAKENKAKVLASC